MLIKSEQNKLVEEHLWLVNLLVKKCYPNPVYFSKEDLIQEGNIGLIRAAKTFNPELGFKFSTYARNWILSRIQAYINQNTKHKRNGIRIQSLDKLVGDTKFNFYDITPSDSPLPDKGFEIKELSNIINKLPKRQKYVIEKCFGEEETLTNIGKQLNNITKERTRQIKESGLENIRRAIDGKYLFKGSKTRRNKKCKKK